MIIDITPAQAAVYGAVQVAIGAAGQADDIPTLVDLLNVQRRFLARLLGFEDED